MVAGSMRKDVTQIAKQVTTIVMAKHPHPQPPQRPDLNARQRILCRPPHRSGPFAIARKHAPQVRPPYVGVILAMALTLTETMMELAVSNILFSSKV